jgi:putative flippase GtrA
VRNVSSLVRFTRFNLVGVLGIGVQLACVAVLVHVAGLDPVIATAAGVTAAIVHNFGWHVRWTWRDRMGPGASKLAAFARFVGANGAVSLIGSVLLVPVLTRTVDLPIIPANVVTIAACGLLNYWVGGRVCFPQARSKKLSTFATVPVENRPVP